MDRLEWQSFVAPASRWFTVPTYMFMLVPAGLPIIFSYTNTTTSISSVMNCHSVYCVAK